MVLELPSAAWSPTCSSLSFQLVPGAGPAALTLRCVHLGETPRPPARCRLRLRCSPARPRSRGPPLPGSGERGGSSRRAAAGSPALESAPRAAPQAPPTPPPWPRCSRGCGAPALYRDQPAVCGEPSPRRPSSTGDPRNLEASLPPPYSSARHPWGALFHPGRIQLGFLKFLLPQSWAFPSWRRSPLALALLVAVPLPHFILFYFFLPSYLVRSENPSPCSVPAVLSLISS